MLILRRVVCLFLLINKWIGVSEALNGRSSKFQKLSLLSRTVNTDNLPKLKEGYIKKQGKELKEKLEKKRCATVLAPVLETYERYRGQLGFSLELQKVSLYYAVDYSNDPIVSQYPKNEKHEVYKPQNQFHKPKKPNYYTLVKDFLSLFTQEKQDKTQATYSLKQLDTGLPNGVMLFMDPNACAEHVVELNKQDKEARMASTKLNTVYKLFETGLNFFRDRDIVNLVVPFSESLVYATNKGGSNFNGTPVFTTDPPIYSTKRADSSEEAESSASEDKFNSKDKLVVFFTPTEAKEFYKKVRWEKTYKDEKTGKYYRIWSKSPPYRPDVKVTSLEKIYGRVHGSEPFWGYLLEVMPPTVKLEKRTEFMLKESSNLLLAPWYSLKKVLRGLSL
ncbi:conserved hypothetical protein [Theileria orientalis strain Shintoku]|uniref:Uncharacterized protein n=1 Tax=Theileria orientalis strain Shintoku TaxID=869250 RepID=J4D9K0_THEOR|nr:conserved hypothetical protein [Theileria orientalis strain Shintoku]PVC50416.1 hypothetical protein MACL_00002293 [Theileria orientalis]BAM41430.1 conserved hypothetical protein [Theileria orientalis strain Shintoku]|eukprot:XP_009691731.1 conserved hypothetical protein [Theileria orientalis strain Shintoku]